jgi:cytochrome P450 family 4
MAVVVLVAFISFLGYFGFKFFRDQWKLHKLGIPNPNLFPMVIEIFYPMWKLGIASAEDRFKLIAEYCLKFPDMMKLWLGWKLVIFVNNPDKIQKVLMSQKCLEKWNFFYSLMDRDHGLIAASVKRKWKEHRKFFNFSFNLKILESFMPMFIDYSEVLCENLEKEIKTEKEFDFSVYAKKASFDILCATSLGTNMKDYRNEKSYEKIFDAFET